MTTRQSGHAVLGLASLVLLAGPARSQEIFTIHGNSGNDNLGFSVSGAGDVNADGFDDVIAGAPYDDNNGSLSGSARVYSGSCGSLTTHGSGCVGSGGFIPGLSVEGCATPHGSLTLEFSNGLGGAAGFLIVGLAPASLPLVAGCTLNASPVLSVVGPLLLSAGGPGDGRIVIAIDIPVVTPPGAATLQGFVDDPGVPHGFANSAGVRIEIF